MKYIIEPRPSAASPIPICSARGDASTILMNAGYTPFYFPRTRVKGKVDKIMQKLQFVGDCMRLYIRLKPEDAVFMQWPSNDRFIRLFYFVLKKKCKSLTMLVHDIDRLRSISSERQRTIEQDFMRVASRIIVHSEEMKTIIKEDYGVPGEKMVVLTSFDYLTKDEITRPIKKTKDVVFVGQLDKSSFLDKVTESNLGIHINLYGRYEKDMGKDVTYKCKFRADNVSVFEGSWGLVWNGDTVDECTGPMGEYLRWNAPHKLSLFTVAHLPIIIWDKAAKAQYIKDKGIGICVSSLREIASRIDKITDAEYKEMVENISQESEKLRKGEHLLECLQN